MIGLGILVVGGVIALAVLAAIIVGAVYLIGAATKSTGRQTKPDDFPDAVCDSCAASLTRGMKNCPACGNLVRP